MRKVTSLYEAAIKALEEVQRKREENKKKEPQQREADAQRNAEEIMK